MTLMIEISQIKIPLDAFLFDGNLTEQLRKAAAKRLCVSDAQIKNVSLYRRSVDARKKSNLHFVCTLLVEMDSEKTQRWLIDQGEKLHVEVKLPLNEPALLNPRFACATSQRPVVVGSGPAGLFAALYLAHAGASPLLIERGSSVDERLRICENFNKGAKLDLNTNIQFGEGGAGTFSDGKLNTNTKSPLIRQVLESFVRAGAPEEILWQAKPHIGTDKLQLVVKNLRKHIESMGGEVRFNTICEDFIVEGEIINAVKLHNLKSGQSECFKTGHVVLACGHSARDTFQVLKNRKVPMEQKAFSMGVRIEHLQSAINIQQYGKQAASHKALGAADYKLAVHLPNKRGVYTFCMCPGGEVVCASSEEGMLVVNGMSRFARNEKNANSALLVSVNPEDFESSDVLAGVEFQRKWERAAFQLAGDYTAPVQTVGDFLEKATRSKGASPAASAQIVPSYARAVKYCDLTQCLPCFVVESIAQALPLLDRKLPGFANPGAVLTGIETRSSSPVRILRDENFESEIRGLYPCGEGAGYAGGIMSAAVDGLKVAMQIAQGNSSEFATKNKGGVAK